MTPRCPKADSASTETSKYGSYYRSSDAKQIQRNRCKSCKRGFSSATSQRAFGQNKRRLNQILWLLLCSGMSMRRCALVLGIDRKTVARKLA